MIDFVDLGLRPYREVYAVQERFRQKRIEGEINDTVIFCEHYPVFTVGKRDSSEDWLSSFTDIISNGIEVVATERGGRITYHGPGQLIGYFIFDINKMKVGVKDFVFKVEECCLRGLKKLGIRATRDREYPGLWVEKEKIVAVGLNISQGVSMHGFALNIDPDMEHYRHIVPCGIKGRGITAVKKLISGKIGYSEMMTIIQQAIGEVFT